MARGQRHVDGEQAPASHDHGHHDHGEHGHHDHGEHGHHDHGEHEHHDHGEHEHASHGPAAPAVRAPERHSHGHAHGHHGHDHGQASRSALRGALILNGLFLLVEAGVGWWSGSLALLSDAAHMVGDVGGLLLALVAATLAATPETARRTFGLVRAEILGAFVNGLSLVGACALIFHEAYERLSAGPPPVPGQPVLVVGVVGLCINLGSAYVLWRSSREGDLNVRGALVHMLADALGSLGAIVAAVLMLTWNVAAADAVVSVVIGLLVLYSSWGLLRESTLILLQFAPPGFDRDALSPRLSAIPGVAAVHAVRAWSLGSGHIVVTAHLTIHPDAVHAKVLCAAEALLRGELGAAYTTIQLDPHEGSPCAESPR